MTRRLPANGARERGAVAVEFALLLPILLLIVFGIIDFGRALNAQITITQAAREGARLDALGYPVADVCDRAVTAATGLGLSCTSPSDVVVEYSVNGSPTAGTCPSGSAAGGGDAVVKVSDPFSFVTPISAIAAMIGGSGFGSSFTLTAQGVMPCEN